MLTGLTVQVKAYDEGKSDDDDPDNIWCDARQSDFFWKQ